MNPEAAPAAGGAERTTTALGLALLAAGTCGVWSTLLGAATLWLLPAAALAVGGLVRPGDLPLRLAALVSWPLVALLLSGAGPGDPVAQAREGAQELLDGTPGPQALALWLVLTGTALLAAPLYAGARRTGSSALAFVIAGIPFVVGLAHPAVDGAPWHGAVVLGAALLWVTRGRLRSALPGTVVACAAGILVASVAGPEQRLLEGRAADAVSGGTLGGLSFGRLSQPSDDPMAEVRAEEPSLWRMQVLTRFDGRTFTALPPGVAPSLPEPASVLRRTVVSVRGLEDRRAMGPGTIEVASGPDRAGAAPGEAAAFGAPLQPGTTYGVASRVTPREDLRGVRRPEPSAVREYLQLFSGQPDRRRLIDDPRARALLSGTDWDSVARLADDLSRGARDQLEIVERVERHLLDPGAYRYTLEPPAQSDIPVLDFLTRTHAGYCQHFAAGAAVLLRMAGVPTRVVIGFATGERTQSGGYLVRERDAHAWIEVWFPERGWVSFDPTPPGVATIDPSVDSSGAVGIGGLRGATGTRLALALLLAVGAVGAALVGGRRRQDAGELGEALARLVGVDDDPSRTVTSLEPQLRAIGPATAALGRRAERAAYVSGAADDGAPAAPRTQIRRAVVADLGLAKGWLLLLGLREPPPVDGIPTGRSVPPPS